MIRIIALDDLLKARALNLEAERRRERVLRPRFAFPFAFSTATTGAGIAPPLDGEDDAPPQ